MSLDWALQTLTTKTRVLSGEQLAARGVGRHAISKALNANLLRTVRAYARPCPPLNEPLATWEPGEEPLECGAIAYQIRKRWDTPCRPITCYVATPRAGRLYGSSRVGLKNTLQISHDLACSSVYLWHLANAPELAEAWTGEDLIKVPRGEKVPDAFFVRDGKPFKVLEIGGCSYGKDRVEALHQLLARKELPHEFW